MYEAEEKVKNLNLVFLRLLKARKYPSLSKDQQIWDLSRRKLLRDVKVPKGEEAIVRC